ncbi:MAG: hypothetical protein IJ494_10020 [Bacteroides sp.]|nr:hypothetical protein [Bacteroides sp.]
MKGVEIDYNDQKICAATASGITFLISNKEGEFKLSATGEDEKQCIKVWNIEDLQIGDSITVCYKDINPAEITAPTYVRDVNDEESENKLMLEMYQKMKKKLGL